MAFLEEQIELKHREKKGTTRGLAHFGDEIATTREKVDLTFLKLQSCPTQSIYGSLCSGFC